METKEKQMGLHQNKKLLHRKKINKKYKKNIFNWVIYLPFIKLYKLSVDVGD